MYQWMRFTQMNSQNSKRNYLGLLTFICCLHIITLMARHPSGPLFVPTDEWYYGTSIACVTLAFYLCYYKVQSSLSWKIVTTIFYSAIFIILFVHAMGEGITNVFGQEKVVSISVEKNAFIERVRSEGYKGSARKNYNAYCVRSDDFKKAFLKSEFCIDQSSYDKLNTQDEISLHVKQTPFGKLFYDIAKE